MFFLYKITIKVDGGWLFSHNFLVCKFPQHFFLGVDILLLWPMENIAFQPSLTFVVHLLYFHKFLWHCILPEPPHWTTCFLRALKVTFTSTLYLESSITLRAVSMGVSWLKSSYRKIVMISDRKDSLAILVEMSCKTKVMEGISSGSCANHRNKVSNYIVGHRWMLLLILSISKIVSYNVYVIHFVDNKY